MNSKTDTFEGLKAFLGGLGRNNREALVFVAEYEHWPKLALREIERRNAAILTGLPDSEVVAIARRKVSLRRLANEVLARLDEE